MLGHAELARLIRTPICLDESIVSARSAADAIALGACSDHQHQARPGRRLPRGAADPRRLRRRTASPVWCGGMLETGLGRAANVALAALPGFTLPGDVSASDRFYAPTSPSRSCCGRRPGRADRPRARGRADPRLLAEMTTGQEDVTR